MEGLHCPDNVKVHFCMAENFVRLFAGTVNYCLFSYYGCRGGLAFERIKNAAPQFKHIIQDSGLFSLLFGKASSQVKKESEILEYYDDYASFCEKNDFGQTIVEIDCQNIVSPELAWELRKDLRARFKGRIINVFHFSDGKKGLEKMVEYSDYIALSVPEFRKRGCTGMVPVVASQIKKMKPGIDIHLLGCTDKKILERCKFCTSADSTSWAKVLMYGIEKDTRIEFPDDFEKKIKKQCVYSDYILNHDTDWRRRGVLLVMMHKKRYEIMVGSQE